MKKIVTLSSAFCIGIFIIHAQQFVNDSSASNKIIAPATIESLSKTVPTVQATVTTGGTATANRIAKFTTTSNIEQTTTPIFENAAGIGIGNSTPAFKLDISGSTRISSGNSLYVGGQTDASQNGVRLHYNGTSAYVDYRGTGSINFRADNSTGNLTRMTILSSNGNVGINQSNPSQKLEIGDGNVLIKGIGNFQNGTEAVLYLGDNANYIKNVFGAGIRIGTYCWDAPQGRDVIAINNCGNVGIGTVNPGNSKLAVEGRIVAREVKVTVAAFPDFVFEKNYHLTSIHDLEKFISKNKHLPEIPSASEVNAAGGIDVGDMQTKLLQKIEEQTLYIISLQQQIDELQKNK
jgi:hypothetical protein